jgi:hypothetical protein
MFSERAQITKANRLVFIFFLLQSNHSPLVFFSNEIPRTERCCGCVRVRAKVASPIGQLRGKPRDIWIGMSRY